MEEVNEQQRAATDQLQAEVSKWQTAAEEAVVIFGHFECFQRFSPGLTRFHKDSFLPKKVTVLVQSQSAVRMSGEKKRGHETSQQREIQDGQHDDVHQRPLRKHNRRVVCWTLSVVSFFSFILAFLAFLDFLAFDFLRSC